MNILSVLLALVWVLCAVPTSAAWAESQPAAPLQIDRSVKLSFSTRNDVSLPIVPVLTKSIAKLRFGAVGQWPAVGGRPVPVGGLSWTVSPSGIGVVDNTTGMSAMTSALTSTAVRPRALIDDRAHGAIWLYGDALYRYRVATAELERLQPAFGSTGVIRKALVTSDGVWLATEAGALLYDPAADVFRAVPSNGGAPVINAAAVGGAVWLASERGRLTKVKLVGKGRATIAVGNTHPLGEPAEMFAVDSALWLLMSADSGEAYRVAYIDGAGTELEVLPGRYFSLREEQGRLVARAHARTLIIDPRAKTASSRMDDANDVPITAITFQGSSYSIKDPSEIVEQRPVDLSRGWSDPELPHMTVATKR